MPSVPVPADPGWDDDLAWLDRDPMTPAELEAQLDRLCVPATGRQQRLRTQHAVRGGREELPV